MKLIKKFENYRTREEMCNYLCNVCGMNMSELEEKSDEELSQICNEMEYSMTKESMNTREEMCDYLCNVCGMDMSELEEKSDEEIHDICREMEMMMSEAKKEKWIQDAIKKPGALRSKMNKKEGERITKSEINKQLSELKSKDKDNKKPGVQGLSKKDLTKFRQLNLAKTLKGLKEHQETENYMFFANLETIKRLAEEILNMDHSEVDMILSDGHGWATDHIATSKDDVEEVFNFLASHRVFNFLASHRAKHSHTEPTFHETESEMKGIRSFADFKK